jgi:adenylate cyclase
MRVLSVTTRIAAAVSAFFGIQQFVIANDALWLGYLNLGSAVVFLLIPQLYRYGDLLPPVAFLLVAYTGMTVSSIYIGSGIGLHFYFAVAAAIMLLVLGIERIVLASLLAVLGAVIVVALEMWVPHNTGAQPDWAFKMGFIVNTAAAWLLVVATVWYALRETARAEQAMETEYQRSETLLVNILPPPRSPNV